MSQINEGHARDEIALRAYVALVRSVVTAGESGSVSIQDVKGIAFHNTTHDELVRAFPEFGAMRKALGEVPLFAERFGADASDRLSLQLVYEYFRRVNELHFDNGILGHTWDAFRSELAEPKWKTLGIANIRNFSTEVWPINLGDEVTVRGRDFEELEGLGFDVHVMKGISDDWHTGFGQTSYVLVAESETAKEPDNLILIDAWSVGIKAQRAIGSLRLLAAGDVSVGPMWVVRHSPFNVGLGGIQRTGVSIPAMGASLAWTQDMETAFRRIYWDLAKLEREGYGKSPGNLDLALRSFMATYDRWPPGADSRLLDSVTALEAVLGTANEISFKLAFRVSTLLGDDAPARAALLRTMKAFYDTRSKLVHGAQLKPKHQHLLNNVDELRSHVRRLLRALVHLAASGHSAYNKQFFNELLDETLVNDAEREKLRVSLGLVSPP